LASQSANFLFRQLKHKVFGEAFAVSLNCTNKRAGFGAIQASKILIEHDFVFSDQVYALLEQSTIQSLFHTGHQQKYSP
jgi:hypothetical protein